ncbi:MAG: Multidrug resistance protein MdtC [Alphaproteobacteria bacterium ADurb.Bin438]|nr:MAG: Multidrug resistance protein MdtC [Alphaproteobacteria bacterium ADurb.Bin438]
MTIPFVVIGLVYGLIIFNSSFGFVALLGAMSLSGMMIKNGIVLIDEIKANKEKGIDDYDAVILAAKSRLRPVVLAAGTTVLGCIPLIQDKFWEALAIVIMAGLMVGTVITMVFVPVLYACFYKAKKK